MTGGLIYFACVCVFLVCIGVALYRLIREERRECNHIYMLYSPTASACQLCGAEHPRSNKMPVLNDMAYKNSKVLGSQMRHWR